MDRQILIAVVAGLGALSLLGIIYLLLSSKRKSVNLIRQQMGRPQEVRERMKNDPMGDEYEYLKKLQRREAKSRATATTMEDRYYYAGIFSARDRREFERLKILVPALLAPIFALIGGVGIGSMGILLGAVLGLLAGLQFPKTYMDRRIKKRAEDIMFYLPLVVEQISIGVSSSLDIGPCLQRVVQMADERDSHNVVTELIKHTLLHVKSGVSLEEALTEIGSRAGHNELKHAFLALSQVARHGGEISKQLNELADAVSGQRETQIDAKIRKLELEATGPVAMVFFGFMLILLIGLGLQLTSVFN